MAEEHEGGGLLHKKLFGLPAPVVLGAGALLVWFVLSHRQRGGGMAQAPSGPSDLSGAVGGGGGGTTGATAAQSLQDQQQQEQLGYQTALDKLRLRAAEFALGQQEQSAQMFGAPTNPTAVGQQGGHTIYSYGTGPVSKAWQQIQVNGQLMWEDIFHPGHIISEQTAQQLAPQDSGPYARGGGGFFSQAWNNIKQGLQLYANSQGVPITLGGGQTRVTLANPQFPVGPTPAAQPASPTVARPTTPATPYYTPPFFGYTPPNGMLQT